MKHVYENLAGYKMSAVLMDVGSFYWTGYRSLRFCASLSNFGKQVSPDGSYNKRILDKDSGDEIQETTAYEKFSPPTQFRIGAAIDPVDSKSNLLTLAVQLNHPVDNAEYIVFGVEYSYLKTLYLRFGHKFNKYEEDITYGVGLNLPVGPIILRVDYGYANFEHLSDPQRFSIGLTL